MTKHFHLVLWIPLLYCALFLVFFITMCQNEFVEFDEFVLEKQANYAADSAIDELLVASDISTDYADGDFITLEPKLAKEDMCHTLCLDFGYVPTTSSLDRVANSNIRALLVCTYDGTYAYWVTRNETHSYTLTQSPKIPYFYTNESTGRQYCLTLDPNKGYWDSGNVNDYTLHKYDTYPSSIRPTNDQQATAINTQVSQILNWVLYESYSGGGSGKVYELPALADTIRGDQTVNRPTVIAILEGNATTTMSTITAECVGGSQLETANRVVGYTLNTHGYNGKYYAYETWWKKNLGLINGNNTGKYFDTVYEAAKKGYNDLNLN